MKKPSIPTLTIYKIRRRLRSGGRLRSTGEVRWGWRLVAANGEKLARHSQGGGFKTARSCWANAKLVAFAFDGEALLGANTPAKGRDFTIYRVGPNYWHGLTALNKQARHSAVPVLRIRRAS